MSLSTAIGLHGDEFDDTGRGEQRRGGERRGEEWRGQTDPPLSSLPLSSSATSPLSSSLSSLESALLAGLSPAKISMPAALEGGSGLGEDAGSTTHYTLSKAAIGDFDDQVLRSRVDTMWSELKVALDAFRSKGLTTLQRHHRSLLDSLTKVQLSFMESNKHPIYDIESKMSKEERLAKAKEAGVASVMAALGGVAGGSEVAAQLPRSLAQGLGLHHSISSPTFTRDGISSRATLPNQHSSSVASLASVGIDFKDASRFSDADLIGMVKTGMHTSSSTLHSVSTTVRAQAEELKKTVDSESAVFLRQANDDTQKLVELCLAQFRYGLHVIIDVARDHIAWLKGRHEHELRDVRISVNQQVADMLASTRADMRERVRNIHERHAKELIALQQENNMKIASAAMAYKGMASQVKDVKTYNDALKDCILAIGTGAGVNTSILMPGTSFQVTLLRGVGDGEHAVETANTALEPLLMSEEEAAKARSRRTSSVGATGALMSPAGDGPGFFGHRRGSNHGTTAHAAPTTRFAKVVTLPDEQDSSRMIAAVVNRVQALISIEKDYFEMKERLSATETRAVSWEQNAKEARYSLVMRESEVRELTEDKSKLAKQLNEAQTEIVKLKDEVRTLQALLKDKDKYIAQLSKDVERANKEIELKDSAVTRLTLELQEWKIKANDTSEALEKAIATGRASSGRRRSSVASESGSPERPRSSGSKPVPIAVSRRPSLLGTTAVSASAQKQKPEPNQLDRARAAKSREKVVLPTLADLARPHDSKRSGNRDDARTAGKVMMDLLAHQADVRTGRRRAMSVTTTIEKLASVHGFREKTDDIDEEYRTARVASGDAEDLTTARAINALTAPKTSSNVPALPVAATSKPKDTKAPSARGESSSPAVKTSGRRPSGRNTEGDTSVQASLAVSMAALEASLGEDLSAQLARARTALEFRKRTVAELQEKVSGMETQMSTALSERDAAAAKASTLEAAAQAAEASVAEAQLSCKRRDDENALLLSRISALETELQNAASIPVAPAIAPADCAKDTREMQTQTQEVQRVDSDTVTEPPTLETIASIASDDELLSLLLKRLQLAATQLSEVVLHPDTASAVISYLTGFTDTSDTGTFKIEPAPAKAPPAGTARHTPKLSPSNKIGPSAVKRFEEDFGAIASWDNDSTSRPTRRGSHDTTVQEMTSWQVLPQAFGATSMGRRASAPALVNSDASLPVRARRRKRSFDAPKIVTARHTVEGVSKEGHGWLLQSPVGPIFVPMNSKPIGIRGGSAIHGLPGRFMSDKAAVLPKITPTLSPRAPNELKQSSSWILQQLNHYDRLMRARSSSGEFLSARRSSRDDTPLVIGPSDGPWWDPKTAIPVAFEDLARREFRDGWQSVESALRPSSTPSTQPTARGKLRPITRTSRRAKSREDAIKKVVDLVLNAGEDRATSPSSHTLDELMSLPAGASHDATLDQILSARLDDYEVPHGPSSKPVMVTSESTKNRLEALVRPRPLSRSERQSTPGQAARLPPIRIENSPFVTAHSRSASPLIALDPMHTEHQGSSHHIWPLNYVPASEEARQSRQGRLIRRFTSNEGGAHASESPPRSPLVGTRITVADRISGHIPDDGPGGLLAVSKSPVTERRTSRRGSK